jgi:hypothetical protein
MTYYESVETVTFTRARALIELQNHGIPESEYPVFFSDMGDKSLQGASCTGMADVLIRTDFASTR